MTTSRPTAFATCENPSPAPAPPGAQPSLTRTAFAGCEPSGPPKRDAASRLHALADEVESGSRVDADLADWDLDARLGGGLAAMLAREEGWSAERSRAAAREYVRFLALARDHDGLVPSVAVDVVWHAHLRFTEHYLFELVPALGKLVLHEHSSSRGARAEERYLRTLALYEERFGEAPPAELWPTC